MYTYGSLTRTLYHTLLNYSLVHKQLLNVHNFIKLHKTGYRYNTFDTNKFCFVLFVINKDGMDLRPVHYCFDIQDSKFIQGK